MKWSRIIYWTTAYLCGYTIATASATSNWWWLATWLVIIPVGSIAEVVAENMERNK